MTPNEQLETELRAELLRAKQAPGGGRAYLLALVTKLETYIERNAAGSRDEDVVADLHLRLTAVLNEVKAEISALPYTSEE